MDNQINLNQPSVPTPPPARKWSKAAAAIIVLAVIAAGVSVLALGRKNHANNNPINNPSNNPVNNRNNNAKNNPAIPALMPQNPTDLPGAHNAFGFNVLKQLASGAGDNNVFISPTSISLALSMVYDGAAGDTKTAMAKTLQLQNLNIDAVNQQSRDLSALLKNPDPNVELDIANSVWSRQGVDFAPAFLNMVKDNYSAEISSLDFNNPASVDTINNWVSQNTNGKIPTIINSISPDMVMYLINAVYFKGSWTTAFDKSLTQDKQFTLAGGTPETTPLMKQEGRFQYLETNDFQSVSLPYGKSQRLSMYVFLPKSLPDFTNSLNLDNWNSWMGQYQDTQGTILLPKFKLDYKQSLVDLLTKLGMGVAFTDNADFSLMRPQKDVQISEVLHKTYLDVNEEGTEAAAVTSVGVQVTAVMPNPEKTFYMEVNKPFFIAIRDNQTQELLFLGTIQNP